jgi:hypothetical protein
LKTLCLCTIALLSLFLAPPAVYKVIPVAHAQSTPISENLSGAGTSTALSVLLEAHQLLNTYGIRPYWPKLPFSKGEDVPASQAPDVVARLVTCESQGVSVKHLDDNDRYSYGVLQIQSSTLAQFEASSGITGSPMDSVTALQMGMWAVENGQLYQWSCARILNLIPKSPDLHRN